MRSFAANARLLQRHERQKAESAAKESSARFGAKQSRFQLRQEEARVAHATQQESLLLSSDTTAPNRDQPSTFSRFDRPPARASAAATAVTTTTTATFGLASARRTTSAGSVGHMGTRGSRRAARFRLEDTDGDQQYGGGAGEEPVVGGLLGAARRPREPDAHDDVGRKKTRVEKFQEVVANSKEHRVHLQREREQRSELTKAVDEEFTKVLHLLERRNKIEEERKAFECSGTPEVRALLQSYREGHISKVLSLRNGVCVPAATPPSIDGGTADGSGKEGEVASFLDKADMELLQKIRNGEGEREVIPGSNRAGTGKVSAELGRSAAKNVGASEGVDEFDRLMQSMRLETRRAIAGDRTLTEEEQEQKLLEQQLLERDRGAMPTISHNREQLTRAELLSRGGDFPDMGDDDDNLPEGELEDNVDISTCYDSDEGSRHTDDDKAGSYADEEVSKKDGARQGVGVAASGLGTLEVILSEMEALSCESDGSRSARAARGGAYHALLVRLYHYAQGHVLHTAQTFRALLVEAQRSFLRRGSLDRVTLLLLHTTSRIFPMTDYRHAVTTPFFLFLCSVLLQMKLKTVAHAADYAVLAGLLCSCMLQGGKFCAEAIIAPLNLVALQVPRSVLEPSRLQGIRVPFPLVGRGETEVALLATEEGGRRLDEAVGSTEEGGEGCNGIIEDNSTSCEEYENEPVLEGTFAILETNVTAARIVRYAYRLLSLQADALHYLPAFEYCLAEPFRALHKCLSGSTPVTAVKGCNEQPASTPCWRPSKAVRADHEALLMKLNQFSNDARSRRTPLAMRSFRPRPIRQFDPMLQEGNGVGGDASMTTSALKSEVRQMKRELREDRKRVVRHLQAEANVERRQRERAAAEVEAQRERKYRELVGSLQAQQHVMKTVDGLHAKARSKKRRSISGLPGKADSSIDNGGS